jgi:hypothetical protein
MLEDEPDLLGAESCQSAVCEPRQIPSRKKDGALRGVVERTKQLQQCALARTARPECALPDTGELGNPTAEGLLEEDAADAPEEIVVATPKADPPSPTVIAVTVATRRVERLRAGACRGLADSRPSVHPRSCLRFAHATCPRL